MKNNLRKSLGAFSLVMCLLITLLPTNFHAIEYKTEETKLEDVIEEIPEDAIYISTEADLLALVEKCRVDTWSVGKVVVLENDIELSSTEFQGIPTFGGVFLGQNHTIKGLYLEEPGSVVGFFRYLQQSAIVANVTIEGSVIPEGSKSAVGSIAGENAGTIVNCTFKGKVSGSEQIGGIAGNNRTSGIIVNCKVSGEVYGNHFIGGIAGENHGVIRTSENTAEINTKSVQNSISVEDITVDSLVNTEVSDTATDMGGIAGSNSGVIRACRNNGPVGYKNMGYNIGGIAGSQKGYIVDCVNYADIQGRKEVGGIVGQMESNMLLDYDADSLQILSSQMSSIEASLDNIQKESENDASDSEQEKNLEEDISNIEDALNMLEESRDTEKENEYLDKLEDYENWDLSEDSLTAARNDLSASLDDAYADSENAWVSSGTVSQNTWNQMENIVSQMGNAVDTVSTIDSNLGYSIVDTSDKDTIEDTLGKVADCINYGEVEGDLNIGGIAGIMAEETDLDAYQDTEISGKQSLNATYEIRNVIRGCKNYAKISVNKQNAGGIVGQMLTGSVLESINLGNINALNADYVGGIVGYGYSLVRDCGSRAIISGDTYVGGIAGYGKEITGCYAFSDIKAYTEKGGAVLGYADTLSDEEALITENRYFIPGNDIGGIDGISYTGIADKVSLEEFLAVEDLDEAFRTVEVRFVVEGKNDVVINVNVGESLSREQVPVLSTEVAKEYAWEFVSPVSHEILAMGETAAVEYLSEEALTNIYFDQTYEASFDAKGTVVKGSDRNERNLAIILANGIFARNTTIEMKDMLSQEAEVGGKAAIVNWQITLSNTGVNSLHYLIPEGVDEKKVQLLVKDASGNWTEREFVVDASYFVFDFTDEDTAFALVADYVAIAIDVAKLAVIVVVGILLIVIAGKAIKKKKK